MEVRNIGQGRQISSDFGTNSVENSGQSIQATNQSSTQSSSSEYVNSNERKYISEKDVEKAVDKFNKLLEDKSTHAEYEIYGKSRDLTIRIVDDKTKQVIQELPAKKLIDMIDKLCELAGVFVDKKA